ncbi:YrrS family protein [Planococcus sp. MERTA32b]|nr:YrrS family protein [Planococcus sp. MER TA 32b]
MAEEKKPYPSRVNKKKSSSTTNKMLNVMIGLVFALILIVGGFIFLGQNDGSENAQEPESVQISSETDNEESTEDNGEEQAENAEEPAEEDVSADEEQKEEESEESADANEEDEDKDKEAEKDKDKEKAEDEEGTVTGGTITRQESDDPIVKETVINTSWEPVGTKQTGEHVSVYDTNSVDWQEKVDAITYATGLAEKDMYIMHIGNGGSPQKSIGTVQSKDMSKKYRVHLEWVEKDGWKPVKMDILNTVEGAY